MKKSILLIVFLFLNLNLLGQSNRTNVNGIFVQISEQLFFVPINVEKLNKFKWNSIEYLTQKNMKNGFQVTLISEKLQTAFYAKSKLYRNKITTEDCAEGYKYIRTAFATISYKKHDGNLNKWFKRERKKINTYDIKLGDSLLKINYDTFDYEFIKVDFSVDLSQIPDSPEPQNR